MYTDFKIREQIDGGHTSVRYSIFEGNYKGVENADGETVTRYVRSAKLRDGEIVYSNIVDRPTVLRSLRRELASDAGRKPIDEQLNIV